MDKNHHCEQTVPFVSFRLLSVYLIRGTLSRGRLPDFRIPLNMVAEKYGVPDQIFAVSTESNFLETLYLFYYRYGVRLTTLIGIKNGMIQITPQTEIDRIVLSTEEGQLQTLQKFEKYKEYLFDWHGYGDYIVPWP